MATWQKMAPDTIVRYNRGLLAFAKLTGVKEAKREEKAPVVKIFWGKPGCGKSRLVHATLKDKDYFKVACNRPEGAWWAKYNGEKIVFFDEYESGNLAHNVLLRIIDWYSTTVKVYGDEVQLLANEFWFTSNQDPRYWVKDKTYGVAWRRRLKDFATITHMDGGFEDDDEVDHI